MRNNARGRSLCWLMPLFMFIVAETVMGNLFRIEPMAAVLNAAIYYMLYLGVYAVFRTTKYGWPVLNVVFYVLAVLEYFIISFRVRPAMFWDVLAIRTAITVSANYTFAITPTLAATFLATAGLCVWAWRCPMRRHVTNSRCGQRDPEPGVVEDDAADAPAPNAWKRRIRPWQMWAAGSAAFLWLLFAVISPACRLDVPMWDPVISFEKSGVVLSTVLSFKAAIAPMPDGYEREDAERLLAGQNAHGDEGADGGAAIDPEREPASAEASGLPGASGPSANAERELVQPTNVICIMNESFSDLRIFNGLVGDRSFETDEPFLTCFDRLSEQPNVQTGSLTVPVFGAMTANTEYEVLTGNSCAFVPQGSIPYQYFTEPGDDSLAKTFGAQGYETIAMHPYPGYNWNRTEAYENLGFDVFYDQEFYDELEREGSALAGERQDESGVDGTDTGGEAAFTRPRGYLSDRSDYDAILHLLNQKEDGEKQFIFNVTMQNHGGFEVEGLEHTVHVTELNGEPCEGEYPKADQYLTLMQMSDDALEYFLGELEQLDEPTMVVLFGDHQPSVETEFFEALYGERWADVPSELKLHSFQAPYLIWTNYDREAEDAGDMSAFLLGGLILEETGIKGDGLFAAGRELREHYDAVHAMGVRTKDGKFLDSREGGGLDGFADIRAYHAMQYRKVFDR